MAKKTSVNIFNDMKDALHDAAAYERGEVVNLRVTRVPPQPIQISPREIDRRFDPGHVHHFSGSKPS
jgi:hypothetical protein